MLERESWVSLLVRGSSLEVSPGLELYSSHSMKLASLREPEMEALKLKGRWTASGVGRVPLMGERQMELQTEGGGSWRRARSGCAGGWTPVSGRCVR